LHLDPSKLDPTKGWQRLFSTRSLIRGLMAIAKATVLCAVAYVVLRQHAARLRGTAAAALPESLSYAWTILVQLLLAVSAAMVLMGLIDYLFQKWKHLQDLRMTRQELMDERRDDDGDPQMRARMRKLQRELSQRKMIHDVATADVVVTNPSHFAVALRYDPRRMKNPKVVAKGADLLAKIIIATAKRHRVAVVEKKPLARYLYAKVAVGRDIPVEVFQAVAEVLVYIYNLKKAA
jgi:flagellar biosynthetic protein FlhB